MSISPSDSLTHAVSLDDSYTLSSVLPLVATGEALLRGFSEENLRTLQRDVLEFQHHLALRLNTDETSVALRNVLFLPDEGAPAEVHIGLAEGCELQVIPAHVTPSRFFAELSYSLSHEYGHLLLQKPNFLQEAFPYDIAKKIAGAEKFLFSRPFYSESAKLLTFWSMCKPDGLANRFFDGLKIDPALFQIPGSRTGICFANALLGLLDHDWRMVIAEGGSRALILSDHINEFIAIRIAQLITPDHESMRVVQEGVLRGALAHAQAHAPMLHLGSIITADLEVWAGKLGIPEIEAGFAGLKSGLSKEERGEHLALGAIFSELWDRIRLKPSTASQNLR